MSFALFQDRYEAGRFLASRLSHLASDPAVVVLALPRGGVPVGFEVARALNVPMDVFVVRKLGVPGREELAMGAIASGGARVLNRDVLETLDVPERVIDIVTEKEQPELERQEREYRDGRPPIDVRGRKIVLVDDGLATGSSMRVAVAALRQKNIAGIVVAVPVAAAATCAGFETEVDQLICGVTPDPFWAVGQWYRDFSPISDEEVRDLLRQAASVPGSKAA
jgi:predicted phosphoribosyltransferase